MPESTVSVRLRAVTSGFSSAMRGAAGSMGAVTRNADRLTAIGGVMSSTVTPALMAVGGAAAFVGMQFESAMSGVEAVTGAGTEAMADMSAQAQELGRTTQFSATEAAGALEFLGMAGFDAQEATEALPDTLNLAAAGGMELAQAADLASNVLQQFALDVDQTQRVTDVLAQTATNSNTSVEQLGNAMSMAGPVANAAGLELEETAAAMGAMGDAGIQASRAGTSLRGAMTRILNATGPAEEALARLGIEAENADGSLRPLPDIVDQLADSGATAGDMMEIFGQRAGPAMAALVEQGGDSLRDLTDTIENSAGAAEEMAETRMDNLAGSLQELRSAAEGAGIALFESGMDDTLTGISDAATGILQSAAGLPDWVLSVGTGLGAVAAAAGPAITGVGMIANQAPAIAENFRAGRRAIGRFATSLAGPWTVAATGAIAVIAAFASEKAAATARVEEFTAAIEEDSGAIGENTRESVANNLEKEGLLSQARDLGINLGTLTDAVLGEADAQERVADATAKAREEAEELRGEGATGAGYQQRIGEINGFADSVSGMTEEVEQGSEAASRLSGAMSHLPSAAEQAEKGFQGMRGTAAVATGAVDDLAESTEESGYEFEVAAEDIDNWVESVKKATDPVFALNSALGDVEDAQRAYDEAVDEHGATSEEARQAAFDQAEAISQLEQAAANGDLSFEEFSGKLSQWVEDGRLSAEQASVIRDRVSELSGEVDAVDRDIRIATSLANWKETGKGINDLRAAAEATERTYTIRMHVEQTGANIAGIGTRGGFLQHQGGPAGSGPYRMFHGGGLAGDEVPAILQRGEFIVNRDAASAHGPLLEAINARRFHDGGAVAAAAPSGGTTVHVTELVLDGQKIGRSEAVFDGLSGQVRRKERRTGGVGL